MHPCAGAWKRRISTSNTDEIFRLRLRMTGKVQLLILQSILQDMRKCFEDIICLRKGNFVSPCRRVLRTEGSQNRISCALGAGYSIDPSPRAAQPQTQAASSTEWTLAHARRMPSSQESPDAASPQPAYPQHPDPNRQSPVPHQV